MFSSTWKFSWKLSHFLPLYYIQVFLFVFSEKFIICTFKFRLLPSPAMLPRGLKIVIPLLRLRDCKMGRVYRIGAIPKNMQFHCGEWQQSGIVRTNCNLCHLPRKSERQLPFTASRDTRSLTSNRFVPLTERTDRKTTRAALRQLCRLQEFGRHYSNIVNSLRYEKIYYVETRVIVHARCPRYIKQLCL